MREILFRGKCSTTGQWIEGLPLYSDEREDEITGIMTSHGYCHDIIPETLGQYTGLESKYGHKIFEGDIVRVDGEDELAEIIWNDNNAMFELEFWSWFSDFDHFLGPECTIAGNIHDHPELLEPEEVDDEQV